MQTKKESTWERKERRRVGGKSTEPSTQVSMESGVKYRNGALRSPVQV